MPDPTQPDSTQDQPDQQQQQAPVRPKVFQSGPWTTGLDSFSEPMIVSASSYRWSTNTVSRGGSIRTRQGLNCIPTNVDGKPRGIAVFTPNNGIPAIVVAIGSNIYKSDYPFTDGFELIAGINFNSFGPVIMKQCVINATTNADGSRTIVDPLPVLMIGDGQTRTAYWDGTTARHLDPSINETPVFKWMEWSNNRLWGSNGKSVRASDLANPLQFLEEDILAEGGSLNFPSEVTGIGQTSDFKNLLVFTDQTTSAIQSNILDRFQWALTPGFQSMIFPNIGCASGKSVINQYGTTWWMSHGGLISIDQAVQTYRSSRIHFQDQAMSWSKGNLSPNISDICAGTYENYLVISVPSGDIYNSHTWVMDQSWGLEQAISDVYAAVRAPRWDGIWTGIRPVEWVTAIVNGRNRCFVLSYDYPSTGSNDPQSNVWEAFVPSRLDVSRSVAIGHPISNDDANYRPIYASVETRLLGMDGQYKSFRFAEIDIGEIEGVVNLSASVAGRRGGYKQILSKELVASQWNMVNGRTTISTDTFEFDSFRPQARVVRSVSDNHQTGDNSYEGVESNYERLCDYGFSLLIEWTGQLSIRGARIYCDPYPQDIEGVCEVDETTDRHVRMDGLQYVEDTAPPNAIDGVAFVSSYTSPGTRQWTEVFYKSLE